MADYKRIFEKLLFKQFSKNSRFTQDSPVYPHVWQEFLKVVQNEKDSLNGERLDDDRVDVILTPHRDYAAPQLLRLLRESIIKLYEKSSMASSESRKTPVWHLATTGEFVVARLNLEELIFCALPLTKWWQRYIIRDHEHSEEIRHWYKSIVGCLEYYEQPGYTSDFDLSDELRKTWVDLCDKKYPITKDAEKRPHALWSVNVNRNASISLFDSVPATKADATRRVFDVDGRGLTWAVLDTGIDATHIAFRKIDPNTGEPFKIPMKSKSERNPNNTRVKASYDFTQFRSIMSNLDGLAMNAKNNELRKYIKESLQGSTSNDEDKTLTKKEINDFIRAIQRSLENGRMIDWSIIGPLLRIPHNKEAYEGRIPNHAHGSHVAGIIGANWYTDRQKGKELIGMCPGIELYDIRVMDDNGAGQEFNILAAIQFVRWLNRQKDLMVIHGANLSLSMFHPVDSMATGRTPVCESCIRLIAEGTVVVASAGNLGQSVYELPEENRQIKGFRAMNITDPGNAEAVITVGATHRSQPHKYGVSYFSSRGPTGDGRYKPDLVAPGDKIVSVAPNNSSKRMDGTSMAAPHVSGAAALLLAKHKELKGNPMRVKEILCNTATDLGRERYFQGFGMLDTLRALQSI